MDKYQVIIGMEIHMELKTTSKMFCGCKNDPFHAEKPNIYTCPVCLGMPGALPVANKKAIEWTMAFGLALGCRINRLSKFDRKHYFYPDLPKGYQISQYDLPFCYGGRVDTSSGPVGITRVHLEEDTGKLMHQKVNGENVSLVDFNRSSVPLVEIVTEPEIYSSQQAKEYAKKLRQIARYLDISDCDMEKGGMRLEANISLQDQRSKINNQKLELPKYKVELKNINSFRFLEKGIEYEIERQKEILESGKTPVQETRGYNAEKNITYSQRTKEEAADYRYFPDPDLPPIRINDEWLSEIKAKVPENLNNLLKKWETGYGIRPAISELLFETYNQASWLDKVFSEAKKSSVAADKLANVLVQNKIKIIPFKTSPVDLIKAYKMETSVDEVSDEILKSFVERALKNQPQAVADYKAGKLSVINFLVGAVIREAKKKVEFKRVLDLIKSSLG